MVGVEGDLLELAGEIGGAGGGGEAGDQKKEGETTYHIISSAGTAGWEYSSVPYNRVHELVEVRTTPTTIEIFHKGQRVASHLRAHGHGHDVTISEHRPRSHQANLEWTPSRMVHWAQTIAR